MKKNIGAIVVDVDRCKGCTLCPDGCITVYRKRIEVEEPVASTQK